MAESNNRVRFLRTKRFPHPAGPRRREGDEVIMDADLARQWTENGVVEVVDTNVDAPTTDTTTDASTDAGGGDVVEQLVNANLDDLENLVADVDDVDTLRAARDRDDRKGALRIYDDRLTELEEAEA